VVLDKALLGDQEQRNILYEISKQKANWIDHILRRNCLLQQVIEGKIKGGLEVTGRRGRRCRKLLDDLKERRGYSHLKEKVLDVESSLWKRLWNYREITKRRKKHNSLRMQNTKETVADSRYSNGELFIISLKLMYFVSVSVYRALFVSYCSREVPTVPCNSL
jgi:hypothetical protein